MPSRVTRRAFTAGLAALCAPACSWRPIGEREARLRVLIGSTPGSSYERIARLLAGPLETRLGQRLVLLANGAAGGRLMARELAGGPRDGTTIGYLPSGLIYAELLGEPGVAYELRRFRWLASATAERRVLLVSRRLGIRTLAELIAYGRALNVSANAVGSPTYVSPLLLNAILGTRLRPIPGFATGAREAAVAAGEVDGILATFASGGPLIASGAAVPIVRLSGGPASAELEEVPVLRDLAVADRWQPLVDLIEAHDDFGRAAAAPPDTPDEHVIPLRRAFDAVLAEPGVVASAARVGTAVSATRGEDVARRLDALWSGGDALSRLLHDALGCGRRLAAGSPSC